MKVKMRTTAAGPGVNLMAGKVYDVDPDLGAALLEAGACDLIADPKAPAKAVLPVEEPQPEAPEVEEPPVAKPKRKK